MKLLVSRAPESADDLKEFTAVINVSDNPCWLFKSPVPYFWFPIIEPLPWGYAPFLGAARIVDQYYTEESKVLIHCVHGAARSPTVAYAIYRSCKSFTPVTLDYHGSVFGKGGLAVCRDAFDESVRQGLAPDNIINVLEHRFIGGGDSLVNALSSHGSLVSVVARSVLEDIVRRSSSNTICS